MSVQEGGVSMYALKERKGTSLYKGFSPRFSKYQETEMEVYIAHTVAGDVADNMKSMVRDLSSMVVRERGRENGRK